MNGNFLGEEMIKDCPADLAIVGGDPYYAEPGCGTEIDRARRIVRVHLAPSDSVSRFGSRPGEALEFDLDSWLGELARDTTQRVYMTGLDPKPYRSIIVEWVATSRLQLSGSLFRALGIPVPSYAIAANYNTNTVKYFDDTSNSDEWQQEVYLLARKLADAHGWERIADAGCGSGYKLMRYFPAPTFTTVGFDLPQTVRFLRQRYTDHSWIAADFDHDAPDYGDVDLIIASDIIEHLANPDLMLRSLSFSSAQAIVISTPDVATLVARGERVDIGPPGNPYHVREWTCFQFSRYVASVLEVLVQELYPIRATQVLVCRPAGQSCGGGESKLCLELPDLRCDFEPRSL